MNDEELQLIEVEPEPKKDRLLQLCEIYVKLGILSHMLEYKKKKESNDKK